MAEKQGDSGNNVLEGGQNPDTLTGLEGDDSLTGFAGGDILFGGAGDDNLDFSDPPDLLDRASVKNFRNTIVASENIGGNDTMVGGTGDDWYGVDSAEDVITELPNEGTDSAFVDIASFDLRVGSRVNVENIVVLNPNQTGRSHTFIGNALDNVIVGGLEADLLDGGVGNDTLVGNVLLGRESDTLVGGTGNDTFEVDTQLEDVVELANQGTDTIRYSFRYDLLTLEERQAAASFSLNTAKFQAVENLVFGGAFDNTNPGIEPELPLFLEGNGRNNEIVGGTFGDRLLGLQGNDTLVGGEGADQMEGGAGDDYYRVENAADQVVEAAGSGTDTIATSLEAFSLNTTALRNVENVFVDDVVVDRVDNVLDFEPGKYTYTDVPKAHTLMGNALGNKIVGGKLADILSGLAGNDWLVGGDGVDQLIGGRGDDEYDAERGDVVVEGKGGGVDVIRTISTRFVLPSNVEDLVFGGGNVAFVGTGNGLGNAISGGRGADRLSGLAGNDTLVGRAGNDTLVAGRGDDVLYGGAGRDVMTGQAGQDWFVFDTRLGSTNIDAVRDFRVIDDTIFLENRIFTQVGGRGYLDPAAFHIGTGAAEASDRVIYNSANGVLSYDPDGTETARATPFAKLTVGLQMTFADIFII